MHIIENIPKSIAIIMDGNRRWAQLNNMLYAEALTVGMNALYKILKVAFEYGVSSLIVYAFSSENTNRHHSELNIFLQLMASQINNDCVQFCIKNKIKISFIGELDFFSKNIIASITEVEKNTASFDKMNLAIALNYGARQEIVQAINKLDCDEKRKINTSNFGDCLLSRSFQDIDLLIRSGGEKRLSNFLLWNLSYAELYFCDTLWPDFCEKDFILALTDYNMRSRRYGI